MVRVLRTDAPAKVNWTLEVLRRRPDGYHDISSVMSTVSLCDQLTLRPAPEWRVSVDAPDLLRAELEQEGANLVQRALLAACHLVQQSAPGETPTAAHIHLVKHIPAAAGLGGGSSDAAAALRLLVAYWRTEAPGAARVLGGHIRQVAAALGSDVPFFLRGGTQLAAGRGELLRPARGIALRSWLVLLTPPFQVERKTARLYGALLPEEFTNGDATARLWDRLATGSRYVTDADLVNGFEGGAAREFPDLGRYRRLLAEAAGAPAHLCGAGPSLFALVRDGARASRAARRLRRDGHQAYSARVVGLRSATRVHIAEHQN